MPAKAPLTSIECTSLAHLHDELASVQDALACTETEDTWEVISRALSRLSALCNGNASTYPADLVAALRASSRPINSALNSERTRLSGTATESIATAVKALGRAFEPLIPHYLPTLLTLCTRTNKVFVTRAKECIHAVIEHTQSPSILHYLGESTKDKSVSLRLAAAEAVVLCLNSFNPPDLERESRAKEIEAVIRVTAVDANADIRKTARKIFDAYKILLPGRVQSFTDPLTPTIRKYLDIKNTAATRSQPPSRPTSSQSVRSGNSETHGSSHPTSSRNHQTSTTAAVRPTKHTRTVSTSSTTAARRPARTPTPEVGVAPSTNVTSSHDPARRVREEPKRVGLAKLDMPPPDYIPTRSADSGPQRPLSATDLYFPHHAAPPERIASGPQRVALVDSMHPSSSGTTGPVRSGPFRPVMLAAMKAGASSGAGTEDGAEKKERVVGGARRVLRLPEPTDPAPSGSAATTTAAALGEEREREKERSAASRPIRPRVISTSKSTPAVPLQAASAAAKEREEALRAKKLASSQGASARGAGATGAGSSTGPAATAANSRHARAASGGLHAMTASAKARAAERAQEKEKAVAAGTKSRAAPSSKAAVPPRPGIGSTVTVRERTRAVSTAKTSSSSTGTGSKSSARDTKAQTQKAAEAKSRSRAGTQEPSRPPSRARCVTPAEVPLPESPKVQSKAPVLEENAAACVVQAEDEKPVVEDEEPAPESKDETELQGEVAETVPAPAEIPLPPSHSTSTSPISSPVVGQPSPTQAQSEAGASPEMDAAAAVSCEDLIKFDETVIDPNVLAPALIPIPPSAPSPQPPSTPGVVDAHTPEQQQRHRAVVEQTPISALVASIQRGFLGMHGVPLSPMREEEEVEDESSSIIVGAHPAVGDADPDGKVFDDPEPVPARGPVKVQPLFVRRGRTVPQQV